MGDHDSVREHLKAARNQANQVLNLRRKDLQDLKAHIDRVRTSDEKIANRAITRLQKRAESHTAEARQLLEAIKAIDAARKTLDSVERTSRGEVDKLEKALANLAKKADAQKSRSDGQRLKLMDEVASLKDDIRALRKAAKEASQLSKRNKEQQAEIAKLRKTLATIQTLASKV